MPMSAATNATGRRLNHSRRLASRRMSSSPIANARNGASGKELENIYSEADIAAVHEAPPTIM